MDKKYGLNFLKANQPMPNDNLLNSHLINTYDQIRKFFLENPDEECISLFLNSFGEYNGMGVYQLIEDVILKYDHEIVVPYLQEALKSEFNGVKYWCAQICENFPDDRLINPLMSLMQDSNPDIQISAITALSQIRTTNIICILKEQINIEKNCEVKDFLIEVINDLKDECPR